LDSGHGREIARLLRELAHERRCSIVIVSHDERLREIADRTLWLEDGTFREYAALVTDPVCQMSVLADHATAHFQVDGTTFWFCSKPCREEFAADPQTYVQRQSKR
jgi:putative ABC transport system ATP-binding protein